MPEINVPLADFARDPMPFLDRVRLGRETLLLRQDNATVAVLSPTTPEPFLRDLPGLLDQVPKLSKAQTKAWADEIESARREVTPESLRDPWAS